MTERTKLLAILMRINVLCSRIDRAVCSRIDNRTDTQNLDALFDLSERANALFRRVNIRYEQANQMWSN